MTGVSDKTSRGWHAAAADTAAAVGAAARTASPADAAHLNRLADSLSSVSGHRRPTRAPAARSRTSARRVAATMLAANRDDTTLLWLAVMKQVLATSAAISDAMAAQGHARHAAHIRAAIGATERHYAGRTYTPARQAVTALPSRTSTIPSSGRTRPPYPRGDFDRGR